jgi:hypothetical protein
MAKCTSILQNYVDGVREAAFFLSWLCLEPELYKMKASPSDSYLLILVSASPRRDPEKSHKLGQGRTFFRIVESFTVNGWSRKAFVGMPHIRLQLPHNRSPLPNGPTWMQEGTVKSNVKQKVPSTIALSKCHEGPKHFRMWQGLNKTCGSCGIKLMVNEGGMCVISGTVLEL